MNPLLVGLKLLLFCFSWTLSATVEELISKGDSLDASMRSAAALEVYLEALPLAPNRSALLRRISKQFAEMITEEKTRGGKLNLARQAVIYAERALAAPDADADARVGLAICLAKLADLSDNRTKVEFSRRIRELCMEALRLDADHELAHHVLGRWHLEMALINPLVRGLVSLIYGEIPPASKAEAERLLRRALALNPQRVATKCELARVLWYQGRHEDARMLLAEAKALPSSNRDDPELIARAEKLIN